MSNKSNSVGGNKILLNENGRIVTDASEVAEIFNAFYGSIAGYPVSCDDGLNDVNLTEVIRKHCQHKSIINIQLHMGARVTCFDFQKLCANDMLDKIKSLKTGKSPGYDGIQAKFLKLAGAILASSLSMLFNKCAELCTARGENYRSLLLPAVTRRSRQAVISGTEPSAALGRQTAKFFWLVL